MHIDLDDIVERVRDAGHPAHVAQTGGGTATIYAGLPAPDVNGDERYPVIAGPGSFAGPGWTRGVADTGDFYIGPDDDGETPPIVTDDDDDEGVVAALIVGLLDGEEE